MLRVGRFNFGDERIQSPWEENVQTTLESVLEQRKQRWELLVEQIVRNWKEELGKKSKSTFQVFNIHCSFRKILPKIFFAQTPIERDRQQQHYFAKFRDFEVVKSI